MISKKLQQELELLRNGEVIIKPGKKMKLSEKEIKETELSRKKYASTADNYARVQAERLSKSSLVCNKKVKNTEYSDKGNIYKD